MQIKSLTLKDFLGHGNIFQKRDNFIFALFYTFSSYYNILIFILHLTTSGYEQEHPAVY